VTGKSLVRRILQAFIVSPLVLNENMPKILNMEIRIRRGRVGINQDGTSGRNASLEETSNTLAHHTWYYCQPGYGSSADNELVIGAVFV
jgi:hypothetical protein